MPGFHTHTQGAQLIENARLSANVTRMRTTGDTLVEHPSLRQMWRRDQRRLGHGGYGYIFRETLVSGSSSRVRVVKKQVSRRGDPTSTQDAIKNELALLLLFGSQRPNLFVHCQGWFKEDQHLMIAMDLLKGDLADHLDRTNRPFSERDTRTIVRQVLAALAFMHDRRVAHRDVKLGNIMIASRAPWSVRLGDFGLSKYHADTRPSPEGMPSAPGTRDYKAPELWFKIEPQEPTLLRFQAKTDVYSLGVMVYRMLTGEAPYRVASNDERPAPIKEFCREGMPRRPLDRAGVSGSARKFVERLTHWKARHRPTASEALGESWL